jgi:sulfite reductase (ferredoxin)
MTITHTLVNTQEIDRFEEAVEAFGRGELDSDRFQSMRLQQGVYGQRQEGVNMVRIKLPGGRITPHQAMTIAATLQRRSNHDRVHITTRQSMQIHHVPLEKTADALRDLATVGLTSREACNNTVRNITACPLAGRCAAEHTDVQPYLNAAVRHFLRHPLAQHMPRKFKTSFSGCATDCAQGMLHDLGVIATHRDGKPGFRLLAGGGLGHKPRRAIVLEEFIPAEQLLPSMEAVLAVHNRYSDRTLRAKSRIKFLVERFGTEGFREKYREELARSLIATAPAKVKSEWRQPEEQLVKDPGAPRQVVEQRQQGLFIVPVHVPVGDISAPQLKGIAQLMIREELSDLRTTQDQNLILLDVPQEKVSHIQAELAKLALEAPTIGDNATACPGNSTCRLGITSSKALAASLSGGKHDLRIRVSGCHNGCAQPETGDIGVYGEGKRLFGKLVPHYRFFIGGDGRGHGDLALKSHSIPAGRVEQAVKRVKESYEQLSQKGESFFTWSQRLGTEYFDDLLHDLREVTETQLPKLLRDHGDSTTFKVEQLGGGECAGAAQDKVAANFAEASNERNYRRSFLLQRKFDESIECAVAALRLSGNSLLFVLGENDGESLEQIAAQLSQHDNYAELGNELLALGQWASSLLINFDPDAYNKLLTEADDWSARVAGHCQSLDGHLDLSSALVSQSDKPKTVDLSSFDCPLHFIKARNSLQQESIGNVVGFLFGSEDLATQASQSLAQEGHEVLAVEVQGGNTHVTIRKAG